MTLKHVYIIFNFYHILVSGRNLMLLVKFSFQICSLIIIGHWNPYWILCCSNFTVSLHNYDLWTVPDLLIFWDLVILMKSRGVIFFSFFFFLKARALLIFGFAVWQMWEMKTHVFNWWKSINFQLLSQALFYMFPSERSSLTVNQEQIQLTWLGAIWCILNPSELHFICEMRRMKASSWSSCKD